VARPPTVPAGANDVPGEERVTVDGVTFERGATVVLRPGGGRDTFDRLLDGRRATLERIYLDYDDRVYLAVTVDDDPGQELMRETGRYLFFFANEVQPA
jgi:phytoene dehydrogenase-like protein